MLTDCTTGPEAGRKCIHPSRIITLAETIRYWNGYGAGDEARTRYLHLGKVALYRMSYTRMGRALLYHKRRICQVLIFAFSGSFSIHPTVPLSASRWARAIQLSTIKNPMVSDTIP